MKSLSGFVSACTSLTLLLPGVAAYAATRAAPSESLSATHSGSSVAAAPSPVTSLPSIFVQLTDPDPSKNTLTYLNASKDNSVGATLNLVDASNANYNLTDLSTTIKGRGNFTWTLDKKPYQIKFQTDQAVLGMAPSKTWVLLANHADTSLLRNKVAYDLAAAFGLDYSPESRFVDLTINGEYLGNYLLCEKTEVKTNRVALTDDRGILLELDNNYGLAEDYHFYTRTSNTLFVLKDAKLGVDVPLDPTVEAAYKDIQDYLNRFESVLYAPDQDWAKISSMIDVESFIKYYFVQELTENPEITQSSIYFYKDGPNDVLHAGPVWDFDSALASYQIERLGADPVADYVKNASIVRAQGNGWFGQLFRNEEFVTAANDMYSSRLEASVNNLTNKIDAYAQEIEESAIQNFVRWPVLGKPSVFGRNGHIVSTTWAGEVAYLRNWVGQRAAFLAQAYGADMPIVRYSSHVANIGWQPAVNSGMIAGAMGRSLAVEALQISVLDATLSGSIQGNAHVQNIGWIGWGSPGSVIGTTGRSLRMEAVQLRLTSQLATTFDIWYRAYVQNTGWMSWVRNGATAGTVGMALRMEAIQVRMLPRSASAVYSSHIQNIGWMPSVADGAVSGTTGRSLRLEALRLHVIRGEYSGDIRYRAHVQNIGWMSWTTSANMIGTVGRALRLEAFEIVLTGALASHYSIRYRAHVQNIGWQPYVADGQTAGTVGQARRVEAVMIQLVPKTP